MLSGRLPFSLLALAGASLLWQAMPATAAGNAGFTAAQVARGATAYTQSCAGCHGAKLQGVSAPALGGKMSAVAQQSVAQVYVYLSQQMPMTAPGSLPAATYLDITAYILKQNGHKPSSVPLTIASAKTSDAVVGSR